MAHFMKLVNCDGSTWYMNLDMIVGIDYDEGEVELANGTSVNNFDEAEWRTIMKFVKGNEYY